MKLRILREPIDQTWSIERIAAEAPPTGWGKVFVDAQHELKHISDVLIEEEQKFGQFFPAKKDIFAAFRYTPLNNVKVVIFGQDPYPQTVTTYDEDLKCIVHNAPRAVGMSFSVRKDDVIPSSLQNIFTELSNTVKGFIKPNHGDLTSWAKQGVLLLNSCLTVRGGQPGSHGSIWLDFISKVLRSISLANPKCIFLLWGNEAKKLKTMIGEKSVIFEASHPSGRSASRGFFGCDHFNKVNDVLIKNGKIGINWHIKPHEDSTKKNEKKLSESQTKNNNLQQDNLIPVDIYSLPIFLNNKEVNN